MKIALIDNYDSFTYNLYHLVKELGFTATILPNDRFQLNELESFDKILLSPGPGIPKEAGLLLEVIRTYSPHKSILGVCLGEQAIGEVFGAKLTNLNQVCHGVQSTIHLINSDYIFHGLPTQIQVGRYHSWIIDTQNFPTCLEVTAISQEGYIMGIKHRTFDVHGIQFHPESILTPNGKQILGNWLKSSLRVGSL